MFQHCACRQTPVPPAAARARLARKHETAERSPFSNLLGDIMMHGSARNCAPASLHRRRITKTAGQSRHHRPPAVVRSRRSTTDHRQPTTHRAVNQRLSGSGRLASFAGSPRVEQPRKNNRQSKLALRTGARRPRRWHSAPASAYETLARTIKGSPSRESVLESRMRPQFGARGVLP